MTATPLRIGLLGYGHGGRCYHAPLLASLETCEFVGVVTRSPERRAQARADHRAATFSSLTDLAAAGAEAVAISTPPGTHRELVEEALDLGLAVVCDKAIAPTESDARAMVAASERTGMPFTVYQNRRWDAEFRTLRGLVKENRLGRIRELESGLEFLIPRESFLFISGGGILLDLGSHLIDQAVLTLGPVARVYGELRISDDAEAVEEGFFISLAHLNGAQSHLSASWFQRAPGPRLRVTGEDASFVIGATDPQEAALHSGLGPADLGDNWGRPRPEDDGKLVSGDSSQPIVSVPGGWQLFYEQFAESVRGNAELPVNPNDAVYTARVIDAVRSSSQKQEIVSL